MKIDIENMVSITEANQNFSKVARNVDEKGSVLILKNNRPKYILIDIDDYKRLEEVASDNIENFNGKLIEGSMEEFSKLVMGE